MAQENVEIVRAVYEAFNCGDWDGMFRDAHSDFEITLQRGLNAGRHRGKEQIQALLEDQFSAFDTWKMELAEHFESGDQLVAFVRSRLKPKGSSVELENFVGHLWTIRNRKILSMHGFPEREKALEAAGLSE